MKDENRPGSRPWSLMGSEDINLVSSQRLETALNSQRVYQAENLPQTYRCAPSSVVGNQRRGADSGRKTARGPIGVGTGGFPEPGKLYLRDFRGGLYGSDDGRPDSGAGNANINGGLSMKAMVGRNAAAGRATPPEWDGREGESDEEDDDDDDDEDDGDGEMEGEVEGMVSVDGRQDTVDNNTANGNSNTANSGSNTALEGFQKGGLDREGGIPKTAMQNPSLGMFLSPPFLGSFPSPSGASAMLDATSAGHATSTGQNGGSGVSASSGFYRDGLLKDASSVARENNNNNNNNNSNNNNNNVHNNSTTLHHHTHQQGRIGHPSPMGHGEGALTVGPVSDSDHYYTQLLQSTGPLAQKEAGVEDKGTVANTESSETSLRTILSDPLTGVLMDDAMILSCGHSFGSGGLQHVLEARVCLSCGQPITNDSMAPNHALRAAVQAYRREEEYQSLSSKLAKRRRDKFEQDKVGFSDPVPMDCSRGKGVQFPFVVNDRVIIKGNKRTPDRFVGREAVITTQCLNGWYVVKTLDNAETVKLQYRSLLKVGEHQSSNEISQKALGPTWL